MTGGSDTGFQHILIIDDDDRLRLLLRRFLEESDFRVTDVGSAADARRMLDGIIFDLIIVDIMMPGETGLEFLADIRKDNKVPALFLTAMAETELPGLKVGQMTICQSHSNPASLSCASGQSLHARRRAPAGTTAALHSALTVLIAAPVF